MSEEYFERYNKSFLPFHNPVDLSNFYSFEKKAEDEDSILRILYIGRIGTANEKSIISFAKTISTLKDVIDRLEFHVYSKDFEITNIKRLGNLPGVYINPPVSYNQVPDLLIQFNLLLLPLDFTVEGLMFAKLSFPTKATEFMLSGIPILVFAPSDTELSKYFSKNLCGFCLTRNSESDIRNALEYIISHPDERRTISRQAIKVARENFDSRRVRNEFMRTLAQLRKLET
jgi:glycosyltransferase involved in cell wall biosynthesis